MASLVRMPQTSTVAVPTTASTGAQVRAGVEDVHMTSRTGSCFITFTPAFTSTPVVVLTVFSTGDLNQHASISLITASECDFTVWNENFADATELVHVQWMACLPTDAPQNNCPPVV